MALLSSVFRWFLSSMLDQNLVQKRASLERKSKSEFARLVFLFDPERSTFGPDRFCSKDHSFWFIKSVTKRLRRPCVQIINKLIYNDSTSWVEPAVVAAKAKHDPHDPHDPHDSWFLTPVIFDEKFPALKIKMEILKTEKAYVFSHYSFIFLDNLASWSSLGCLSLFDSTLIATSSSVVLSLAIETSPKAPDLSLFPILYFPPSFKSIFNIEL